MKKMVLVKAALALASASLVVACKGGGGGPGGTVVIGGSSTPVISYPYETVYGDVCTTNQPTPGCTFNRDGSRVRVSQDPDYNQFGYGSDDLWFVKFDSSGRGAVYDDLGHFQYYADVTKFAGYIHGTTIGVGTTGLFWENVSNGTYWLGQNGVLYNANSWSSNFGKAINNEGASEASDTNFAALNTETNKALVKAATAKLMKDYGFKAEKAQAVASALNRWAVAGAERGYTTTRDMDVTFKAVFGVEYMSALAAVKDLQVGETAGMRELTDRSASALGLNPAQAQQFIKGMYKKALASWGFDVDSIHW